MEHKIELRKKVEADPKTGEPGFSSYEELLRKSIDSVSRVGSVSQLGRRIRVAEKLDTAVENGSSELLVDSKEVAEIRAAVVDFFGVDSRLLDFWVHIHEASKTEVE